MSHDQSSPSQQTARILSFRRRAAGSVPTPARHPAAASGSARPFAKYEGADRPGEYRHRMMVNLAAFLFVAALTYCGYWLADTLARQGKDQDCVLSGRRSCGQINVTPKDRW